MDVRKVVIPVAGWGTRSLPATKNIPKEMLPIFKKPVVQYVVEEAQAAGIDTVVLVTSQNKTIIEDHFDHNLTLENLLERKGKTALLQEVRAVAEMVDIIAVRQKVQLGLGHAVLCAREVVKNEPFAVMVGDDLMFGKEPGIKQLLDVAKTENMAVVGVIEVPENKVDRYGIIQGEEYMSGVYRVRNLVEKPALGTAPSRLAIVGRYVLVPEIFKYLEKLEPGVGGELQLTDALQGLANENRLLAVKLRGQRFAGQVARTAGAIDTATRTLQVEVALPNRNDTLLPGAYVQVTLPLQASQSLLAPTNTLLFRAGGTMVAVLDAQARVTLRRVSVGRNYGTEFEVIDGISDRERLVLNPPDWLADGQTVVPVADKDKP